jgi:hypothetical protein
MNIFLPKSKMPLVHNFLCRRPGTEQKNHKVWRGMPSGLSNFGKGKSRFDHISQIWDLQTSDFCQLAIGCRKLYCKAWFMAITSRSATVAEGDPGRKVPISGSSQCSSYARVLVFTMGLSVATRSSSLPYTILGVALNVVLRFSLPYTSAV